MYQRLNYYIWCTFIDKDGNEGFVLKDFRGFRAFSEAEEYYMQKLLDPSTLELTYDRNDGGNWVDMAAPIKRDDKGEWTPNLRK